MHVFQIDRCEIMIKRAAVSSNIAKAAKRISGQITRTPLLPFQWQGQLLWVKAECLQYGGSFKLRGATNRLMLLDEAERARGVVAFSSGNHGLGVAIAAQRLGIAATIVMPSDSPAVKRNAIISVGARIVDYNRQTESREEIAARIASETNATVVPSFDDADIIEGQGTVGLEIDEKLREAVGAGPDKVLVCCGGGGLSAGIALALPDAEVITVEPEGWDDMARSLIAGRMVPVPDDAPPTRCDALQTKWVSPLTFGPLYARGVHGLAVSEEEVEQAMAFAARHLKLVVEPGGAVALAALLSGKAGAVTDRTVVILSGGNVEPLVYADIISRQAHR
jgi:threonine dehydratase